MDGFNEVSMNSILVVLSGLFLRLVLPILATALAVLVLRILSRRWQAEHGGVGNMLCWQTHRLPNGYLKDECLNCDVFISAPVTSEKVQVSKHIN
jgi:hypothetical protein